MPVTRETLGWMLPALLLGLSGCSTPPLIIEIDSGNVGQDMTYEVTVVWIAEKENERLIGGSFAGAWNELPELMKICALRTGLKDDPIRGSGDADKLVKRVREVREILRKKYDDVSDPTVYYRDYRLTDLEPWTVAKAVDVTTQRASETRYAFWLTIKGRDKRNSEHELEVPANATLGLVFVFDHDLFPDPIRVGKPEKLKQCLLNYKDSWRYMAVMPVWVGSGGEFKGSGKGFTPGRFISNSAGNIRIALWTDCWVLTQGRRR